MKEEALKLADSYEIRANFIVSHHEKSGRTRMSTTNQSMVKRYKNTADMIRKLVAELDKWEKDLHLQSHVLGFMEGKASQAEDQMMALIPLSDEEIIETWFELPESASISQRQVAFARAIEERHGIK